MQHRRRLHRLLPAAEALDRQRRLLLEHVLPVEPGHLGVLCGFLRELLGRFVLARRQLLFARVLRDAERIEVGLRSGADRFFVQLQ